MKGDVIHAYVGCNIIFIQNRLIHLALLIKELSRKRAESVIDSTHCINKQTFRSESNCVEHISEE
jgi:hypothetical protein